MNERKPVEGSDTGKISGPASAGQREMDLSQLSGLANQWLQHLMDEGKPNDQGQVGSVSGVGNLDTERDSLIPRDRRGILWASLDEVSRKALIEAEARRLLDLGVTLTSNGLKAAGHHGYGAAIFVYYPDKLAGLQAFLGLDYSVKFACPESITLVDNGVERTVKPVDQGEGRDILAKVLNGEMPVDEAPPIYVTDLRKRKHNPSVTFYWTKGPLINLNTSVGKAFEDNGAVVFIFKEDIKLGYKWFDVYPLDEDSKVDLGRKLDSLRINMSEGKIESNGWYGPDLQSFFDFVSGDLQGLDFGELSPIVVRNPKGSNVYLGRLRGEYIGISFNRRIDAENLTLVPRENKELGYIWLDGYKAGDDLNGKPIFTRRVSISGENRVLEITDWNGPEFQALVDWIYKKAPISKLGEVEVSVGNKKIPQISLGHDSLYLRFGKHIYNSGFPIILIPHEKGRYRWIEAQQKDPKTGGRVTISLFRLDEVEDRPTILGDWQGYEREVLVNYLDGKAEAGELENFSARLSREQTVYVARYGDKALTIALRSVAFKGVDLVVLKPRSSENGDLIIEVVKEGDLDNILAISKYDREKRQFKTRSQETSLRKKPSGHWTEERLRETGRRLLTKYGDLTGKAITEDEDRSFKFAVSYKYPGGWVGFRRDLGMVQSDESGIYRDNDGKQWAPTNVLADKSGRKFDSVAKIIAGRGIAGLKGRGFNNKIVTFYPVEEALEAILGSGEIEELNSDQANQWLRGLMGEEGEPDD